MMVDIQTCKVKQCSKRFDFDKGGFDSSFGGYVCSAECAKKAASEAGRAYAIHDETDKIIETNADKINDKAGINLQKPPIRVKHSELKREGDSAFKSVCPACDDGMLLMRRDQHTFKLLNDDICILCGQHFIYEEMPNLP